MGLVPGAAAALQCLHCVARRRSSTAPLLPGMLGRDVGQAPQWTYFNFYFLTLTSISGIRGFECCCSGGGSMRRSSNLMARSGTPAL